MCYDDSARPPFPPIRGSALAADGERIELTAGDGNRFGAFTARAGEGAGGPGIAILPDVRGLHPFYTELALRFAEAGVHATAFDYFGRTAGIGERGEAFEWRPHVDRTRPGTIAMDVAATVAHVRSEAGGAADRVYTVGFCFGGRNSFNQAARDLGLAGVIGFYGRPQRSDENDATAPIDLAATYACPVLGLFGGADGAIPPEAVRAFGTALDAAGVPNELIVYDGAPHSFFDRTASEHAEACDDAWRRILAFLGAGR
jgi:carboxymethylenebutenolidase